MVQLKPTRADGKPTVSYTLTQPNISAIAKIVFEALPGTIVRNVHRKILKKIAAAGKKIMVEEIRKKFRVSDANKPRSNGEPRMWQTPTGALANSIGVKIPTLTEMKNDMVAFAAIGPRSDFKETKNVRKRVDKMKTFGLNTTPGTPFGPAKAPPRLLIGRGPEDDPIVRPARYAHLANFGHQPGASGFGITARAHDYMTPTSTRLQGQIDSIVNTNYQPLLLKTFDQDTGARLRQIAREVLRG